MTFEIEDDALEISLIEDLFVFGSAKQESGAAEIVDLAGDALGVVEESGDETVGEERLLSAGETEMMFDVSAGLLEIEGGEMITNGDALLEGLIGGKAEFMGQIGLTE